MFFYLFISLGGGGGSTQATAVIKYLFEVYHEREVKEV